MNKLFFVIVLLPPILATGTDLKYPVKTISQELLNNVDVVVREDHVSFRVKSKSSATYYVHKVITLLNAKSKSFAEEVINYDKLTKVKNIKAFVYNEKGEEIKRLRKEEVYDGAILDGVTLHSDLRFKGINLIQKSYPYTIEIEYEINYDFLFRIPTAWWGGERISHEHASFQLIYPLELKPRYQVFNINIEPVIERPEKGVESLTWKFENIKPINSESFGPEVDELIPHIMAAPTEFEFSDYVGKMDSWQNFGQWIISLNKGRDVLSDETKKRVHEIASKYETREEKVKALYEFMQSKTRYVSIQLGIGGYQPFEAAEVDKTGYGDCKALSNYMIALLKEVGISANYVLIRAGGEARTLTENFPSSQFNHAIAAVPGERDTLWLECTSQTNPFGYQGKFTGDRKALMITDEGAKVVNTIKYLPEQNVQSRFAEVSIDSQGNAVSLISTTYSGLQYENNGLNWAIKNPDNQKKWIEKNTSIPAFTINAYTMNEKKDKIPSVTVDLNLMLSRYASISGKRLFMMPNLMNRITRLPEKLNNRKLEVVQKANYADVDSIIFTISENFYPEFLPEPVRINSRFGEYKVDFKFHAGKIIYTRKIKMWEGRFPKESYNELVEFYKNVNRADNQKLVFINKT